MTTMTSKELSALEDTLNSEMLLVKKYQSLANQCTDPQLKAICTEVAGKHQQHFNTLFQHLN